MNARGFHLVLALLAFATLATQIWATLSSPLFSSAAAALVNLFSFFTILTNTLAAVVVGAVALAPAGRIAQNASLRASVALYIAVVAVVYHVLLAPLFSPTGLNWVLDQMFHTALPALYIGGWIAFAPKAGLRFSHALYWLIYPVMYFGYAMARGAATGLYPYFFLDPAPAGYGPVLQMVGLLAVAFLLVGLAQIALCRALARG
ncbi:MAG: Pr6Pr family membrane protein [Paracoccaceae bacterium]